MIKFLKALLFFIIVLFAFALGVKYSYLFSKADLSILTEADISFADDNNSLDTNNQAIVIEEEPVENSPLTEAEQQDIENINDIMPDFENMNAEVGNELSGTGNMAPMDATNESDLNNINNDTTTDANLETINETQNTTADTTNTKTNEKDETINNQNITNQQVAPVATGNQVANTENVNNNLQKQ